MTKRLSHLDSSGRARMVDVSSKADTRREAVARGSVRMRPETLALVQSGGVEKGDVIATARLAGIMAGKRTAEFLDRVLARITLAGATFLALIATLPQQAAMWISASVPPAVAYFLGGTSILIVVSVALDLVDKLNSALLMRNQGGFMGGRQGGG